MADGRGPVLLPGYDGRRRTFFMYGFEGIHEARPRNNGTPTVPTEKMRNGDFSELLALGSPVSDLQSVHAPRDRRRPLPAGSVSRQHHSARLINPVARKVLEYFAHPLTAGNADGTSNFQNPALPETSNTRPTPFASITSSPSKQRMYARVSWYDRNSNYNNYFDNLSTGEWFKFVSRQAAVDHVYVLTPITVLNVRYGYNWFVRGTDSNPANHGFDLTSLGFPASTTRDSGRHPPVPAFRHHGLSGHRHRRRGAAERQPPFMRHPEQVRGRALAEDRPGVPAISRDRQVLCQQSDRTVRLRLDLDPRAARQLADRPRFARPVVRLVPARHSRARDSSSAPPVTTSSRRRGVSSFRTTGGLVRG